MNWKNRQGIGYFVPCIITLAFAMLLSVLVTFSEITEQITGIEKEIRTVMREQMQEEAKESYDTVKRGSMSVPDVSLQELSDKLCANLNLIEESETLTAYHADGSWKYRLRLTEVDSESTGTVASCSVKGRLELPVRFLGTEVSLLSVPFCTNGYLTAKFE